MKNLWLKTTLTAAALATAMSAQADSTSTTNAKKKPTNTSTATANPAKAEKKALPVSVSTNSYFFGPGLIGDKSYMADDSPDAKTGLFSRHALRVKHELNKTVSVSAVGEGDIQHTIMPGSEEKMGFRLRDPYARIDKTDLIATKVAGNELNVDGQFRVYAPLSDGSKASKNISRVSIWLNPTMKLGKSRFSISALNYARYWIQSKDFHPVTSSPLTRMDFYTGPSLNYDINDKTQAFLYYEAEITYNTLGQSELNYAPTKSMTDLEPGVSFQATKAVSITPFLNWYTNQELKTTSVNLNAAIKLM